MLSQCQTTILSVTLLFSSFPLVALADDLTLSIATKQSIDGVAAIDIDKPFRVVFTNNTDKEVRIWHPLSREGYYCLTFKSENLESGHSFSVTKRRIDDDAYFKAVGDTMEPGSNLITIRPRDTFTTQVEFIDYAWGKLKWLGVPEPNTGAQYSIEAHYQSPLKNARGPAVWTGSISSAPTKVRVVSQRIDTPHEYLWNNLPNLALRVMKNNPDWINRRDEDQRTPLHVAARFKHVAVVTWLLENGADVNAIAYNGFTPLHLTNDPGVVKTILKFNPDLSIACRIQGQTPLQCAVANHSQAQSVEARRHWKSIVDLYFAAGAEYDILTAIALDDLDRVKAILANGSKLGDGFYHNSPLRRAASLGRRAVCRYLIEKHQVDVDQFDQGSGYPIIKDALAHPNVVKLFIDNGADLQRRITWQGGRTGIWIIGDNATALHYAARDGIPESIQLLLDADVDLFATTKPAFGAKANEQTALDVAAFFGKADNAKAIINHPQFKDASAALRQKLLDRCLITGASTSWISREADRAKLLKILLKAGADPNATNTNGHTAVQIAARKIHPNDEQDENGPNELIKILRDNGATLDLFSAVAIGDEVAVAQILDRQPQSVDARGPDGYPALHFAVDMDYKKVVRLLLEAGADVDIRNESESTGARGGTPLHSAAFWGRDIAAALLINAGADVNARGDKGSTPLHSAARLTNVRMAKLLLDNGALIDPMDNNGETPLDWCRELNWTNAAEIEKVFREYRKR